MAALISKVPSCGSIFRSLATCLSTVILLNLAAFLGPQELQEQQLTKSVLVQQQKNGTSIASNDTILTASETNNNSNTQQQKNGTSTASTDTTLTANATNNNSNTLPLFWATHKKKCLSSNIFRATFSPRIAYRIQNLYLYCMCVVELNSDWKHLT